MREPSLRPLWDCQLMIAGHNPHWIQVNISFRGPIHQVEILGVEGNYITFGNNERLWTYWNHSEEELQNALAYVRLHPDTRVEFREQGTVLGIEHGGGMRMYSLTSKPNGECSDNPLHPGGLSIPLSKVNDPEVQEVLRQVGPYARQKAKEKRKKAVGLSKNRLF